MRKRASELDACAKKAKAGFTVIETILFIAIAGMVFAGVIVGTNGAIRRQRYKDTVQSFADELRDIYSLVENPEVVSYGDLNVTCGKTASGSSNSGRGRSDCSVYGVLAQIRMNSGASTGKEGTENIEAYWVIGRDQREVSEKNASITNDIDFLRAAGIRSSISYTGYSSSKKIEAKKASLYWGAQLGFSCDDLKNRGSHAVCTMSTAKGKYVQGLDASTIDSSDVPVINLLIYRSPLDGAVRTVVQRELGVGFTDLVIPEKDDATKAEFVADEVKLCVIGGDGMSYDGGLRMIKIAKNASGAQDVLLTDPDSEENICN